MKKKIAVGVMGSATLGEASSNLISKIDELAHAIVESNCVLITGETTGAPELILNAVKKLGGLTVGISPAHNLEEQKKLYQSPANSSDVVIYSGFGLKGRNVLNIRSSDVVIIVAGAIGTLNEFTIAYDENKIVGVLEGSGGVADLIREILNKIPKQTKAQVFYDKDPKKLLEKCIKASLHGKSD